MRGAAALAAVVVLACGGRAPAPASPDPAAEVGAGAPALAEASASGGAGAPAAGAATGAAAGGATAAGAGAGTATGAAAGGATETGAGAGTAGATAPPAARPALRVTVPVAQAEARALAGGAIIARVLVDRETVGAELGALSLLDLKARVEVPLHRHETSAELIVVRRGGGRVPGAGGRAATVGVGDAIFVPAGAVHGFRAGAEGAELVVLYAPPGPEARFRDPAASAGTTRVTPAQARADRGARPRVVRGASARRWTIAGGRGSARILVDHDSVGDGAASVGELRLDAGVVVPEHVHDRSAEILLVTAGTGTMTVEGAAHVVTAGMAIYVPPGARHGFTAERAVEAIQFYAPGGPEQRFKGNAGRPTPTTGEQRR